MRKQSDGCYGLTEDYKLSGGNATNPLKMSEFLDYCKQRWPDGAAKD